MLISFAILLAGLLDAQPLLAVHGDRLVSLHELRVSVARPRGFRVAPPVHRKAEFSGHPFAVSVGAFVGPDSFVMVHAERVLDRSGASDYSSLDDYVLGGQTYRTKAQCAALTLEDVAEEHDLRFLNANDFSPAPAVYLRQLFRTTDDHNAEVVITYGERLTACPGAAEESRFRAAFDARPARTVSATIDRGRMRPAE